MVTGPFGSLSSKFDTLVDFIARERALQTMELRDVKPVLTLAVHRRAVVRRVGLLTSRGWAQHIVNRWRDAVSNRPAAPQAANVDLAVISYFINCSFPGPFLSSAHMHRRPLTLVDSFLDVPPQRSRHRPRSEAIWCQSAKFFGRPFRLQAYLSARPKSLKRNREDENLQPTLSKAFLASN